MINREKKIDASNSHKKNKRNTFVHINHNQRENFNKVLKYVLNNIKYIGTHILQSQTVACLNSFENGRVVKTWNKIH